jgi:hypothetical protein
MNRPWIAPSLLLLGAALAGALLFRNSSPSTPDRVAPTPSLARSTAPARSAAPVRAAEEPPPDALPPAPPRDVPWKAAAGEASDVLWAEAPLLTREPAVRSLFACVGAPSLEKMIEAFEARKFAVEPRFVAFFREPRGAVVLVQGSFSDRMDGRRWRLVGERGRIDAIKKGGEALGLWGDAVLLGPEAVVEGALRRLEGEVSPRFPLAAQDHAGDVFGLLGPESQKRIALPGLEKQDAEPLAHVTFRWHQPGPVVLVAEGSVTMDEHGHASREVVELTKTLAERMLRAQDEARAAGQREAAARWSRSRARPLRGKARVEAELELEALRNHLARCATR